MQTGPPVHTSWFTHHALSRDPGVHSSASSRLPGAGHFLPDTVTEPTTAGFVDTAGTQLIQPSDQHFPLTPHFPFDFVFLHKFKRIVYCSYQFKGYFPLTVIIKHWLRSLYNTLLSPSYTQQWAPPTLLCCTNPTSFPVLLRWLSR